MWRAVHLMILTFVVFGRAKLYGESSAQVLDETPLTKLLRRSLTVNNYDYMPSIEEEPFPPKRRNLEQESPPSSPPPSTVARDSDYFASFDQFRPNHRRSRYLRRRRRRQSFSSTSPTPSSSPTSSSSAQSSSSSPALSRRMIPPPGGRGVPLPGSATSSTPRNIDSGLLFPESYWAQMDGNSIENSHLSGRDEEVVEINEWLKRRDQEANPARRSFKQLLPKEKKYRVIPLGHKRSGRRSMSGAIIQEEGSEGIVMVNFGGEEFPQFRLPADRRQYMHHTPTSEADTLKSELQQKLKKNNDEYDAITNLTTLKEDQKPGNESARRAYGHGVGWGDSGPEKVDESETFNAAPQTSPMRASGRNTPPPNAEKIRHKMQKLKRFVDHNKDLLRGVVNMRKLEQMMNEEPVRSRMRTPSIPQATPDPTSLHRLPASAMPGPPRARDHGAPRERHRGISDLIGSDAKSDLIQKFRELYQGNVQYVRHHDKAAQQNNNYEDNILGVLRHNEVLTTEAESTPPRLKKYEIIFKGPPEVQRHANAIPPQHKYEDESQKFRGEVQRHANAIPAQDLELYEDELLGRTKDRAIGDSGWYFGARAGRGYANKLQSARRGRKGAATDRIPSSRDPRDLDLAPAVGGRISAMRSKGRICQRNVLIPEGPKYNSKGRVYLKAFRPEKGSNMDYARTVEPKFLIPKCCNCCKKSVLGCE